jgi:bacterioferritin-associated ferredoxin
LPLLAAAGLDARGAVTGVAHAMFDIGDLTAQCGVTLCGLVAEHEAVLLPELTWQGVPPTARCGVCERAAAELVNR